MLIRRPAVAGTFYPLNSFELKNKIKNNLIGNIDNSLKAVISPHAGYEYCGKTMGKVYAKVPKADTYLIFGPSHYGNGTTTSEGIWETPLGKAEIDSDFINEFKGSAVNINPAAHKMEHSIEVQVPWLQYKFGEIKFVPILIDSIIFNDTRISKEIIGTILKAIKKINKKIFLIASSDFTHYGIMYGYTPFTGTTSQILKGIEKIDLEAAGYISKLMPEKFLEFCKEKSATICGYGAIEAAMLVAKDLGAKTGEIIDYTTSFETSRDKRAIVGYCGIGLK